MGQQTQQTPANINRLQKHKQTSEWHSRIVQSNPLPSPPATPPSQCYHPLRPRLPSNTPTQRPVHRGRASLPSTPENFPFFVLPHSLCRHWHIWVMRINLAPVLQTLLGPRAVTTTCQALQQDVAAEKLLCCGEDLYKKPTSCGVTLYFSCSLRRCNCHYPSIVYEDLCLLKSSQPKLPKVTS